MMRMGLCRAARWPLAVLEIVGGAVFLLCARVRFALGTPHDVHEGCRLAAALHAGMSENCTPDGERCVLVGSGFDGPPLSQLLAWLRGRQDVEERGRGAP